MANNEILPFATGAGANVLTPEEFAGLQARQTGFQSGVAVATQLNTVWRQSSFVASMIGQFISDYQAADVIDDGDVSGLEQQFLDAIRQALEENIIHVALTDTGSGNNVIATASPPITVDDRPRIVVFRKKAASSNTGNMTADFGSGASPLVDNSGAGFGSGAILGGSIYIAMYYAGAWRVLGGAATYTNVTNLTANSGRAIQVQTSGAVDQNFLINTTHDANPSSTDLVIRQKSNGTILQMNWLEFIASLPFLKTLTAPRTYYVNATNGSDLNDGTSLNTAFRTIQRALDQVNGYNLNGYSVTINVADGVYPAIVIHTLNGTGSLDIIGNPINPDACLISATNSNAISGVSVTGVRINGFKVESSSPAGVSGNGILFYGPCEAIIQNITFGVCRGLHLGAYNGAQLTLGEGSIKIAGGVNSAGGAYDHMAISANSSIQTSSDNNLRPTLYIVTPVTFLVFIVVDYGLSGVLYKNIVGAGNVSGSRFSVTRNGIMVVNGAGPYYYPGNSTGYSSYGGQYV